MTDAEVICQWMEPKPPDQLTGQSGISEGGWWKRRWSVRGQQFKHWPNDDKTDSLDTLREVEAKLTDAQAAKYNSRLDWVMREPNLIDRDDHHLTIAETSIWHATAEQKIAALAAVLRGGGRE